MVLAWQYIILPLVGPFIITLDMVYGRNSVEASDGENHIIYDLNGEIGSRVVHVRDRGPHVGGRVEFLAAAHPGNAVEAAWKQKKTCRMRKISTISAETYR